MADNTTLPGTGDVIAGDDITDGGVASGAKVQRMKVGFGADGAYTDVTSGNPLPVSVPTHAVTASGTFPVTDNGGSLTVDGSVSLTGADMLAGDTGQGAQLVAGSRKEVTFSTTTAQAVASTDASNYRWVSVHVTSQGTGSTVTFMASNDNASWVVVPLQAATSTTTVVTSTTTTGIYAGPCNFRYFRLSVGGITAGTTAGVVDFFAQPGFQMVTTPVVDTELPAAAALADATANPTSPAVATYALVWNGTNWDRRKAATSADATTGTGLVGAGILGFDGTNYRRVKTDTAGVVQTAFATAQPVTDNGGTLSVDDGAGSLTVDGTVAVSNFPATQPVSIASSVAVTDNGGSLTVDGSVSLTGTSLVTSRAGTATLSNVASSATSVTLLAANASRQGAIILNDSTQLLYVAFAATASTTSHTYQVPAGGVLELTTPVYTGALSGIWAAANGSARVTELV